MLPEHTSGPPPIQGAVTPRLARGPPTLGWTAHTPTLKSLLQVPVGRYSATELERLDGDLGFLVGQS